MKITEMIKKLESIKNTYGDLECYYCEYDSINERREGFTMKKSPEAMFLCDSGTLVEFDGYVYTKEEYKKGDGIEGLFEDGEEGQLICCVN